MKYLDMNAKNYESVHQYYKVRCTEMGLNLEKITEMADGCYLAQLSREYWSVYIPPDVRGKGLIKNYKNLKFATTNECGIIDVLDKIGADYEVFDTFNTYQEYKEIKSFYGNKKAERSGEFLMWHITEGARYMENNGASEDAVRAYILHPIYQSDDDYKLNWHKLESYKPEIRRNVLEYRKVANSYLCKPYTDNWGIEELKSACPIIFDDVREMLLADKYQNQKDFLKYHYGSHKRSNELYKYFKLWLEYLTHNK